MSWTITIHGFGSHCNRGNPPADADSIAAKLVHDLRAAGHRVDSATFTHGRIEDLTSRPLAADGVSSPGPIAIDPKAAPAPAAAPAPPVAAKV